MKFMQRVFAGVLPILALTACGAGGGGSTSQPPPPQTHSPPPAPVITLSSTSVRPNSPVTMTAGPQAATVTYAWTFGDGTTGTGTEVTHAYETEGTFNVRLTATNEYDLTASSTATLQVAYLPMLTPSIFGTNDGHFLGQTFIANAVVVEPNGLPLTYLWSFGDGATSSTLGTSHVYAAPGTYDVTFTATNSANHAVTAMTQVRVFPRSALPARTDNVFSVFCAGAFCAAADADTYSGPGLGIWRYHNATSSPASLNLRIDGVQGGQTASLTFTNGQPFATPTAPSAGTLASMSAGNTVAASTRILGPATDDQAATVHTQVTERNLAIAREYLRSGHRGARPTAPAGRAKVLAVAPPPALGTARTWTVVFGSVVAYEMQVGGSCALPSGRNAVFWIDSGQATAGKISPARIQYLVDAFCGSSGAYARLTGLAGDLWGAAAAGSGYIEDALGAPLDVNIVMPGVQSAPWGGYFSVSNLVARSSDPNSNEALAIFVNPSNLIANPDPDAFTGSSLIHELKHHINFYQRTVARGSAHAAWLEETSAMLAEDFLTPAFFNASRTLARHSGYLSSGGGVGYIDWGAPDGPSYNLGGTFAGFLHRWYGLDIDRQLITDCDDQDALESYQCVDALIVRNGGISFADEFERLGASVFGGMARGNVPDGFGLPAIEREGYLLEALDSTPTRQPQFSTPVPLDMGNLATVHTYTLDVIEAGQTVFERDAVQIPAGATLILVIQ